MANKRTFNKLPEIFRTNTLDKFFKSTVDQWFHESQILQTSGYIGRKNPATFKPNADFYLPEIDHTRQNYQLEPILVNKDVNTADVSNALFYDDTLKILSVEGSNIDNHHRLFKSKAYSWAPPIDLDKFINYENYFWYEPAELIRFDIVAGSEFINITEDIVNQKTYTSHNGIKFTNGLKVRFTGSNIAPQGYLNKDWIVRGVGNKIELLDTTSTVLNNTQQYTATNVTDRIDYVTIERGSVDHNPWSRTNGWYHKDVLLRGTGTSTGETYTDVVDNQWDNTGDDWDEETWDATVTQKSTTFALDSARQAIRPIIEFDHNLELYNYGIESAGTVTHASVVTHDNIQNGVNIKIDGITVATNDTIIFLNATNLLNYIPWDGEKLVNPATGETEGQWDLKAWDIEAEAGSDQLGKIYKATVNVGSGVCTLVEIKNILEKQKVLVLNGENLTGSEYHWSGSDWMLSQQKTKTTDEPLFQLYDNEKIKLQDVGIYPSSTFTGNPVFSYDEGTGTTDTVIGKALTYKEFGQIADIVFKNNLEDTITYSNGDIIGYKYLKQYDLNAELGDVVFVDTIDLIEDTRSYAQLHGQLVSLVGNIDDVVPIAGKTVILFNNTQNYDVARWDIYEWDDDIAPPTGGEAWDTTTDLPLLSGQTGIYTISIDSSEGVDRFMLTLTTTINHGDYVTVQDGILYGNYDYTWQTGSWTEVKFKIPPEIRQQDIYNNAWNASDDFNKQRVIERYVSDVDGTQDYNLQTTPVTNSPTDIIVTVDGELAKQSTSSTAYDYHVTDNILTFTTNKVLSKDQLIEVRSFTKDAVNLNDTHYFEIPNSLEANPDNKEIVSASASELLGHFTSIIENQSDLTGTAYGINNYRDTLKDRSIGNKILQHESTLLPLMNIVANDNFRVLDAIRFNQRNYVNFKNKFLQRAEFLVTQHLTTPIDTFVDIILEDMHSKRSNLKIYKDTNVLAFGKNYTTTDVTALFNSDYIDLTIQITPALTDRSRIVYVYRKKWGSADYVLLRNVSDYLFGATTTSTGSIVTRITFTDPLQKDDKIQIRVFENIQNSFIPPTPSSLGMYQVYPPRTETDNTYFTGTQNFIVGHDGSRILMYGDYKDQCLLELEKRIYNAIPDKFISADYIPEINQYDYIPGKFRDNDYSLYEFSRVLEPIYQRWSIENNIDTFTHRDYDTGAPFTWNYKKEPDKDDKEVPGSWRGIFLYYYDTHRPHTHPWEMLGFTIKPTWWETTYGQVVKSNTSLWQDLENGIIRHGNRENFLDNSYLTNNPFRRTGLSNYIPVDESGNLLDPVKAGIFGDPATLVVGDNYSAPYGPDRDNPWTFGDWGPAEFSIRLNSVWPFIINKLAFLTRPAEWATKNWDTLNVARALTDKKQLIFNDTKKRNQIATLRYHQVKLLETSIDVEYVFGYQQWIYNLLINNGIDYDKGFATNMKTTEVNLGYKVGGFISNDSISIQADTYSTTRDSDSIFIPTEDKTIKIYNGASEGIRAYSGVIIEITPTGYAVYGYDPYNPVFRIIPSITTGTKKDVVIEDYTVEEYTTHYDVVAEVAYGFEFSSIQEVFDFLISYQRYLTAVGFVFDKFDPDAGETLDFRHAGKEFIYWARITAWDYGAFIAVSPAAYEIKLDVSTLGRIASLTEIINGTYSVLDKNGMAIPTSNLHINRDPENFIITSLDGTGIFGFKVNTFKSEHIMILNNTTGFNDLIYDPILRLRQDRLKLNLAKTTDWTGNVEAKGYIIRDNTIIPNFDTTANDYRKFFNDRDATISKAQRDSARHLTGYQHRDYLTNITGDEDTSYEFYKGFIRQKGTKESIKRLLRNTNVASDSTLTFYEEFALKVGDFGATRITTDNEIQIKANDVKVQNPLLEFTFEAESVDTIVDDVIQINHINDTRWLRKPKTELTTVWPTGALGYKELDALPDAGYVHGDDSTYKAYDNLLLAGLNTILMAATEPVQNAIAHVAKSPNNEFAVYKLIDSGLRPEIITSVPDSTLLSEVNVTGQEIPTIVGSQIIPTTNVGDTLEFTFGDTAAPDPATKITVTVTTVELASVDDPLGIPELNMELKSDVTSIAVNDSIFINTSNTGAGTEVAFTTAPTDKPVVVIGTQELPIITNGITIITIVGGGGTGATATATVNVNGNVTAIPITNAGTGYTPAPVLTILSPAGSGSGAAAACSVNEEGVIDKVWMTSPGSGYNPMDAAAWRAANVAAAAGDPGGGSLAPGETENTTSVSASGTGAGAAFTTRVQDGKILDIIITNGGTGWIPTPRVIISGGGTGATATCTVGSSGIISQTTVTNPGSEYNNGIVFINGTPVAFYTGDTLTTGTDDGSGNSTILEKLTSVPNVTATLHDNKIKLSILNQTLVIADQGTGIGRELGFEEGTFHWDLTIDDIQAALLAANIPNLSITKISDVKLKLISSTSNISITKGIGPAIDRLLFTNKNGFEVSNIDTSKVTIDTIVTDINATVTKEDFKASKTSIGTLKIEFNGSSLQVGGTGLSGLGISAQTSSLQASSVAQHMFEEGDVVVLNNILNLDGSAAEIGGGYKISTISETYSLNVKIVNGSILITNLKTNEITALSDVNSIPLYDIVGADRDYIKNLSLTILTTLSPTQITVGDTIDTDSILTNMNGLIGKYYGAEKLYTTLTGNIILKTVETGNFTHGEFTISFTVEKKGKFYIVGQNIDVCNSLSNIFWWKKQNFKTKDELFYDVQNNQSHYALNDLGWVENKPNGWIVGQYIDNKEHYGVNTFTLGSGGDNYTADDIGAILTYAVDETNTKTAPSAQIDSIAYSINNITMTNNGTGYTSPPNVTFTGGTPSIIGTGLAVLSSAITDITITNSGAGYQQVPNVEIATSPVYSGNMWTVDHNLGQKYLNLELSDNFTNNFIGNAFSSPTITFVNDNRFTVDWGTQLITGTIDIIKSKYVSPYQSNIVAGVELGLNVWNIAHNLGQQFVNVDIIYSAAGHISALGRYDHPLIEYTDANNLKVKFPTGVNQSGYVALAFNNGNEPTSTGHEHTQSVASKTWTVNHNLGKSICNVDFAILGSSIDAGDYSTTINNSKYYNIKGNYDYPVVNYVNANQLTVTFLEATAGKGIISTGPGSLSGTATATVRMRLDDAIGNSELSDTCSGIRIKNGGTGYTAGDIISVNNTDATFTEVAQFQVSTVSSGVVTGLSQTSGDYFAMGDYTVLPTCINNEPAGGTGNGLLVDLLWEVKLLSISEGVGNNFQVTPDLKIDAPTNASGCTTLVTAQATANIVGIVSKVDIVARGAGYITTPTIVFSGGGGAGAAGTINLSGPVSSISIKDIGDLTIQPSTTNVSTISTTTGAGVTLTATYQNITNFDTWFKTYRKEEKPILSKLFNVGILYDKSDHTVDATMQLLDPRKGIISGLAGTEIYYKLERDPARYNNSDIDTFLFDTDELWGEEQVGRIWWDLSTVRFLNAEQGDNRYRRENWNKIFPGSTIDIYEWTSDIGIPTAYKGTGTVLNNNRYVLREVWNDSINNFISTYFFWVKNKTDVPPVEFRSRSAIDVKNYIEIPTKQGINWYAPISSNYEWTEEIIITNTELTQIIGQSVAAADIASVTLNSVKVKWAMGVLDDDGKMTTINLLVAPTVNDALRVSYSRPGGALIVNNIDHLLTIEDSVLQLRYNTQATENNVHKQWVLLRPDDPRSEIPSKFINKMIDSLIGYDKTGLVIPDTTILNEIERQGTLTRPRQTWFKDLKTARKEFVYYINNIIKTFALDNERIAWDTNISSALIETLDWYAIKESTTNDEGIVTNVYWDADTAIIAYTVPTVTKRNALTGIVNDDIVKVSNAGNNRWKLYQFSTANSLTGEWIVIGSEKATRKIIESVYNLDLTLAQTTELRTIIEAFISNVFIKEWAVETNKMFFNMINYVLAEQPETDWIFKSTYATTTVAENDVQQKSKWKVDLLPSTEEYLNEVKPYSTKIREFTGVKNIKLDQANTHTTDFDNPPYKDTLGMFGTANAIIPLHPSTADHLPTLQSGIYSDYFANRTNNSLVRATTIKMYFDRIHSSIEEVKTYNSGNTGAAGVDGRAYRHTALKTTTQRESALLNSIVNATGVGESSATQIGGALHRVLKYAPDKILSGLATEGVSTLVSNIINSRLTVDTDIANHHIIIQNGLNTLGSLTYDNLNNTMDRTDTNYTGYGFTIYEAMQRWDYDAYNILRYGDPTPYPANSDEIRSQDPVPGDPSEAQKKVQIYIQRYENAIVELKKKLFGVKGAFSSHDKLAIENADKFELSSDLQADDWGWDSDAWDAHEYSTASETEEVKRSWDEGGNLNKLYSEFKNFSSEKDINGDRVGWHAYDFERDLGVSVEQVKYGTNFIYVYASGRPDHEHGPFPNANNPNSIFNQNALWKIPLTIDIPIVKESTPLGPIGIARNGVVIYNPKDASSFLSEDVWHQNAVTQEVGIDAANGHTNEKGQYHYHQNPKAIYDDNAYEHSSLLGYAWDGVPIYGPRAYPNVNGTGEIRRIRSSYRLKTGTRTAIGTETVPTGAYDGTYIEDFEYIVGLGDLDQYNGRSAITPEYPNGIYAYYVTVDDLNQSVYPYIIGPEYYGMPNKENYTNTPGPVITEEISVKTRYLPNVTVDRNNRDSKGFIRPQHEQYPEEYVPVYPKEGLTVTTETHAVRVVITDDNLLEEAPGYQFASAYATVSGDAVTGLTLNQGGTGYIGPASVDIAGAYSDDVGTVGTGATATAAVDGINIDFIHNGGSGYTSAPTITFSGGGGINATAIAIISNGKVVNIFVTNHGTGYTSSPTVNITGGGGSSATATAVVDAIGTLTLTAGGTGYLDLQTSMRSYYNEHGSKKVYALSDALGTTLASNIAQGDTEIQVTDVLKLPKPVAASYNRGNPVPGVIYIGAERVQYFHIDEANNKLLECRRGTGTTADQAHTSGEKIFGITDFVTLTDNVEEMWSPHATYGLINSTSANARFFKENKGKAIT